MSDFRVCDKKISNQSNIICDDYLFYFINKSLF